MKGKLFTYLILALLSAGFCKQSDFKKQMYSPVSVNPEKVEVRKQEQTKVKLPEKKAIYAVIETALAPKQEEPGKQLPGVSSANLEPMVLELFHETAPKTVQNFIDLAQGEKETTDPNTKKKSKKPFYDGLSFHRVIQNFMIQGGCPKGDGTGGPGYRFEDEINGVFLGLDKMKIKDSPMYKRFIKDAVIKSMNIQSQQELSQRIKEADENAQVAHENFSVIEILHRAGYRFNETYRSRRAVKGSLAMANSGPNTNGSQFFINQVDTLHLDGIHTVFGHLISGYEVLDKIIASGNGGTKITKITIVDRR